MARRNRGWLEQLGEMSKRQPWPTSCDVGTRRVSTFQIPRIDLVSEVPNILGASAGDESRMVSLIRSGFRARVIDSLESKVAS